MARLLQARRLKSFVLFAAFSIQFSYGVINPIMPTLVGRYGGGALEIGLLYSALWLAQFLTVPGLGTIERSLYPSMPFFSFTTVCQTSTSEDN